MTSGSLAPGSAQAPDESGQLPVVTLVVAMVDEADTIEVCLRSVLAQDYPAERLEILVYDGGSADGSAEIARRLLDGRPRAAVRCNPRRVQAAAWNLGIAAAGGEVVGILSGHAELAPGYVRAAVAALARTGADMVGGPVRPIGEGRVARAIAVATSTRFGAGGARFRLARQVEEVDTVYMGVARHATYVRFPFDEEMARDQDDELSYRILDAGGRIVCDPAIGSYYRSRATLGSLARQYAAYGYWKVRVLQKHPAQARLRHLVPSAFVVAVGGAVIVLPFSGLPRVAGASVLAAYTAVNLAASAAAPRRGPGLLAVLPIVYLTLHVAYGVGFLAGLVRFRRAWSPGAMRQILGSVGRHA